MNDRQTLLAEIADAIEYEAKNAISLGDVIEAKVGGVLLDVARRLREVA